MRDARMEHEVVKIGIAVSLSGRYALLGQQVLEGLECFVLDANARGGIALAERKLPVRLVVEDDQILFTRGPGRPRTRR